VSTRAGSLVGRAAALALAASACNALTGVTDLTVSDGARDGGDVADAASGDAATRAEASADAASALDSGSGPDASRVALCDKTDETLLLCMTMDGVVADESNKNLQPATASLVTFAPGRVGLAGVFTDASFVAIPESTVMTTTASTIEAFIHPSSLPANGGRYMVVDFDARYALGVGAGGTLLCTGGATMQVGSVSVGKWTHVACVHDPDGGQLRAYIDGTLAGNIAAAPLSSTGNGAAVGMNDPSGDNFDGLIDEVRVWKAARTAAQIAASAQRDE
jgi:hypothetical protein